MAIALSGSTQAGAPRVTSVVAFALIALALLAVLIGGWLTFQAEIWFIGGLIVTLIALGGLAALLAGLGLASAGEAFGLPTGTIRALLAIGLLITFVALGVIGLKGSDGPQLLGEALPERMTVNGDMVESMVARMAQQGIVALPVGTGQTVELHLYRQAPAGQHAMARELMTIISTLLTTVLGFYFGSRALSGGEGQVAAPAGAGQPVTTAESRTRLAHLTKELERARAQLAELGADPEGRAELAAALAAMETLRSDASGLVGRADRHLTEAEQASSAGTAKAARDAADQALGELEGHIRLLHQLVADAQQQIAKG